MAVSEGFEIDAQGRGLAAQPADVWVQRLADRTAFADPGWAEQQEQVQMPGSESTDIGFQLGMVFPVRRPLGGDSYGDLGR